MTSAVILPAYDQKAKVVAKMHSPSILSVGSADTHKIQRTPRGLAESGSSKQTAALSMDQPQQFDSPLLRSASLVDALIAGARSTDPVSGFTHTFYKYPARFSPAFVRAAINAFTSPGDVVLDPFMGGATTIVEARALGRRCVGVDISALSLFLARVKATPIAETDLQAVCRWATRAVKRDLNLRRRVAGSGAWAQLGYHRNIEDRQTWPIRKILELGVASAERLENDSQQMFARAALLRTAQWALDCRSDIPTASRFRTQMLDYLNEMVAGVREYRAAVEEADCSQRRGSPMLLLHRSAEGLDEAEGVRKFGVPRLVLTSPPYPGVHVMYHRWQVLGRKETPAPFWIANSLDGNGLSYYTFGDRNNPGLKTYFRAARTAFQSVARLADRRTVFVQMVAFSNATWQLPAYLDAMNDAGLVELRLPQLATAEDGRLWRAVPNRKWYATKRGPQQGAAREVVLLHRHA